MFLPVSVQKPTHEVRLEVFKTDAQIQARLSALLENDTVTSFVDETPLLWYVQQNGLNVWFRKTTYPRPDPETRVQLAAESRRAGVQMFKAILTTMLLQYDNEEKGAALQRLLSRLPELPDDDEPYNPFLLMREAAKELLEMPEQWPEALSDALDDDEPQNANEL